MTERFKKTNRPEPAWHCWLVSRLKTSFLPETQLVGSAAAMNIILCKSYILILKVRLTQQNENVAPKITPAVVNAFRMTHCR